MCQSLVSQGAVFAVIPFASSADLPLFLLLDSIFPSTLQLSLSVFCVSIFSPQRYGLTLAPWMIHLLTLNSSLAGFKQQPLQPLVATLFCQLCDSIASIVLCFQSIQKCRLFEVCLPTSFTLLLPHDPNHHSCISNLCKFR